MSCDGNRARFFQQVAAEPAVQQALGGDVEHTRTMIETLYDTASRRSDIQPVLADALTRTLFVQMKTLGMTPPAHAADGMPLPTARKAMPPSRTC